MHRLTHWNDAIPKCQQNSCIIIIQLGKSIGVCRLFLRYNWCDKWRRWFLPDDPVETQCTPLSPVLIIAQAAPHGPGSSVRFWLIYSGFRTTPKTTPTEQSESYPRAFRSIGELHEKQVRGLFSVRLLLILPQELKASSLFRVYGLWLNHCLFSTSIRFKILWSDSIHCLSNKLLCHNTIWHTTWTCYLLTMAYQESQQVLENKLQNMLFPHASF